MVSLLIFENFSYTKKKTKKAKLRTINYIKLTIKRKKNRIEIEDTETCIKNKILKIVTIAFQVSLQSRNYSGRSRCES